MRLTYETTVELSESVECTLAVDFDAEPYRKSFDYFTPDDPAFAEINEIVPGTLIGATWEKSHGELKASGWLDFLLATKAWKAVNVDESDLLEYANEVTSEHYED